MKLILSFLLAIVIFGCSKSASRHEEQPIICAGPESLAWLNAKKTEYKNCEICGVEFRYGVYDSTQVIETAIVSGPRRACDGINVVYKLDGSVLLNSGDYPAYLRYLENVKGTQVIWSCKVNTAGN